MNQSEEIRELCWQKTEAYFETLPSELNRLVADFKINVANFCAGGGNFRDFLAGDDYYPVFEMFFALCNDLGLKKNKHDLTSLYQGHYFLVASYLVKEFVYEKRLKPAGDFLLLSDVLLQKANLCFLEVFSGESLFWDCHYRNSEDYSNSKLRRESEYRRGTGLFDPDDWSITGNRLAFFKTGFIAVALKAEAGSKLTFLNELFDDLNSLYQIRKEIINIRRDLFNGNLSFPIMCILKSAGIKAVDNLKPEVVLGMMLLFNPVPKLIEKCISRLSKCTALCGEKGLDSFLPFLNRFAEIFSDLADLFDLKKQSGNSHGPEERENENNAAEFISAGEKPLDGAVRMAEAFLLSDMDFRESWETHRWGFLGKEKLTGKIFPTGFILEILLSEGHELSDRLDELFAYWKSIDCRYFEEDCSLPPDSDSAGLMLRLFRFSRNGEVHKRILELPVKRILANVSPSGSVPTYLKKMLSTDKNGPYFQNIAGNECGSVKAGLLLGLMEYDHIRYKTLIRKFAVDLLRSIVKLRSSVNFYYPKTFWIWITSGLLAGLKAGIANEEIDELTSEVTAILKEEAMSMNERVVRSSQNSSLMLLSLIELSTGYESNRNFAANIIEAQKYDGSWPEEPFYVTPTINNHNTWYSSKLITTSICYRALRRYQLSFR